MGHQLALNVKKMMEDLEIVKKNYKNLKLKTTKNLHQGLKLQREIIVLETEIARQRGEYYKYLTSLKKISEFKNQTA